MKCNVCQLEVQISEFAGQLRAFCNRCQEWRQFICEKAIDYYAGMEAVAKVLQFVPKKPKDAA